MPSIFSFCAFICAVFLLLGVHNRCRCACNNLILLLLNSIHAQRQLTLLMHWRRLRRRMFLWQPRVETVPATGRWVSKTVNFDYSDFIAGVITSASEVMLSHAFVCLFVCLLVILMESSWKFYQTMCLWARKFPLNSRSHLYLHRVLGIFQMILIGRRPLSFPSSLFLFTALHGMQTRSSDEISVCLSVRLSVKRVHCDKTEE